jgi:hypothetical protein
MGFSDELAQCVQDNLPSALVDVLKGLSLDKVLQFASELVEGASVEEALLAIGVGAEAAAAAGAAVIAAGIAAAAVAAAVLSGCVAAAGVESVWDTIKSLGSSVWDVLKSPLADAGYPAPADSAVA